MNNWDQRHKCIKKNKYTITKHKGGSKWNRSGANSSAGIKDSPSTSIVYIKHLWRKKVLLVYTRGLCRGWILDNWLQFQKSVMESKMSTNGGTKKAHLKVQPENTINVLCRNITFGLLFVGTMVFFLFQSWQEQTASKSYIYSFFSTHSCFLLSFARVSIDLAVQCTFSQNFLCWKN